MKKEILFFDGDGTLWYPKSTKHTQMPHWLYLKTQNIDEHYEELVMIPTVLFTLKKLKKMGVTTVLLSTHPHSPKEADFRINDKVKHFKLENLFDEVHATREYHEAKGELMVKILKERTIPKSRALMVGDHYEWDYKSAKDVGVDALLVTSEYMKECIQSKNIKRTITKVSEILDYI